MVEIERVEMTSAQKREEEAALLEHQKRLADEAHEQERKAELARQKAERALKLKKEEEEALKKQEEAIANKKKNFSKQMNKITMAKTSAKDIKNKAKENMKQIKGKRIQENTEVIEQVVK